MQINKERLSIVILLLIVIIESSYIVYKQVTKVKPIEQKQGFYVEQIGTEFELPVLPEVIVK